MKCAVLLLCIAAASTFSDERFYHDVVRQDWETFKMQHNKEYASAEEEAKRMEIYVKNRYKVAQHNKAHALGQTSFTLALNKCADYFPEEMQRMRMRGFESNGVPAPVRGRFQDISVSVPSTINWADKGAVTRVKDQGQCGSCWAFSATGALEGQYFLKTGRLIPLSEQNLLDCSGFFGENDGCEGGRMDVAFAYIASNGGISKGESYAYNSLQGLCRYNHSTSSNMTVRGYMNLPEEDEEYLQKVVATIGPVSVVISSTPMSFHLYRGGVYFDKNCNATDLNHAVLVVGYGTEHPGGDYWLVKNSWGSLWGDRGYIKIARNRGNVCGIASFPVYPLL